MNPHPLAILILSAAAGGLTALVLAPGDEPRSAGRLTPTNISVFGRAGIEPRVSAIGERLARLEERLAASERAAEVGPAQEQRVALVDLDERVQRYLEANDPRRAAPALAAQEPEALSRHDLRRILERLDQAESEMAHMIWRELEDAGQAEAVLAELQAIADANPGDPDAQVDVGQANLYALFQARSGIELERQAQAAERNFERALEADPNHWEARFLRAVALSNYPAVAGKANESIAEFERLAEIQSTQERRSGHAQTFLYLGNMYQQAGNLERAREAWRRGYEQFPDNAALERQVRLYE